MSCELGRPSWLCTNNTKIVIVILILSQFPHLSLFAIFLFSPPPISLLPLLCGQQAFSLLSLESAKHSHFWAADRQELADSVERLLREREREILKMRRGKKGRGGGPGESREMTNHRKKSRKETRCLFSSWKEIPGDKMGLFLAITTSGAVFCTE